MNSGSIFSRQYCLSQPKHQSDHGPRHKYWVIIDDGTHTKCRRMHKQEKRMQPHTFLCFISMICHHNHQIPNIWFKCDRSLEGGDTASRAPWQFVTLYSVLRNGEKRSVARYHHNNSKRNESIPWGNCIRETNRDKQARD